MMTISQTILGLRGDYLALAHTNFRALVLAVPALASALSLSLRTKALVWPCQFQIRFRPRPGSHSVTSVC